MGSFEYEAPKIEVAGTVVELTEQPTEITLVAGSEIIN